MVGRDKIGGDQVSGDKTIIQHQYIGATASRLAYRRAISPLLALYLEVFVGREKELGQLGKFAAGQEPGYLLIEADPGYGKSALVAQLIHRWETGQWNEPIPRLIYYFIREDGRRHTPNSFCSAVNSQLLTLLDLPGGVPADLDSQQNQLLELWAKAVEAARSDRPLLLLVDGLDEMAPGEISIADLLPGELESYVHVVVTSRPNPEPLQQVPLEHPLRQASVMRLHALSLANIDQILRKHGASAEVAQELARRTLKVTKGEPLLARFISQDVAAGGEKVLAALEKGPPLGVKAYFRDQVKQLKARAKGEFSRQVLGLLLVAHGPMAIGELAAVLDLSPWDIDDAVEPIRRFLLGKDRFELMHLELRVVVDEQFSPADKQAYQRRLVNWCDRFAKADWPDETPDYVLAYYAAHLREGADNETLYRLIGRRWMELKFARTHSHRDFGRDVLLSINAAAAEKPPNLIQEIRGSLIYATLNSLATNIPSELLGVLAQVGQLVKAEGYASLIGDTGKRIRAFIAIAAALSSQSKTREAKKAVEQALAVAEAVTDSSNKIDLLADTAGMLIDSGLDQQAVAVMEQTIAMAEEAMAEGKVPKEEVAEFRVGLLSFRAWVLAKAGHVEQSTAAAGSALTAAEAITSDSDRAEVLFGLTETLSTVAEALAEAGQGEQALVVAEQAVTAVQAITSDSDDSDKAQALAAVAQALAKADQVEQAAAVTQQALTAVQEITSGWRKAQAMEGVAQALVGVAQALAKADQVEQAAVATRQALTAVQEITSGWDDSDKARALAAVAKALAEAGQGEQALTAVQAISESGDKAQALAGVAQALAKAGQVEQAATVAEQALIAAQAITVSWSKARAQLGVAQALAQTGQVEQAATVAEQALTAAQVITSGQKERQALTAIACALAEVGQVEHGLTIVRAGTTDSDEIQALTAMAKALAEAGQADQAVAVAEQEITGDWEKAQALAAVAKTLAEAGQLEQALAVAERALTTAQAITSDGRKAVVLAAVAKTLAEAGQLEQATAVTQQAVRAITGGWAWVMEGAAQALVGVAQALAMAGQFEQAETVAEQAVTIAHASISDSEEAETLAAVAQVRVTAGQFEQAVVMAEQAVTAAQAITSDYSKSQALTAVAQAFADVAEAVAETSQFERTMVVAEQVVTAAQTITSDFSKSQALTAVAKALAEAGQAGQAITAAQAITSDSYYKAEALTAVAKALAEAGQAGQAITAAQAITSDYSKSQALTAVAKALAEAGQIGQAITAAQAITSDYSKSQALTAVAKTLAEAGQIEQAVTAAQAITSDQGKTRALADVAQSLAGTGQFEQATALTEQILTAAQAIYDDSERSEALTALARVQAELGRGDQALAMVQAIGSYEKRSEALTRIAHALAKFGQLEQAVAVAERALTGARIDGRDSLFDVLTQLAVNHSIITDQSLYELGQHVIKAEKLWTA